MSACPLVRWEQLGYWWTDSHKVLYLAVSLTSVEKVQVWWKSNKCNRRYTWGPMCICRYLGYWRYRVCRR